MAVPKRKVSKARRDKRRSSVWKLTAPTLTKCTQCGEYKLPHQVCAIAATTRARKSSKRKRNQLPAKGEGAILLLFILPQKEAGTWR